MDNPSKIVITKHRALYSKAGELRSFKTYTFNSKVEATSRQTNLTEDQVTELMSEIQCGLADPSH